MDIQKMLDAMSSAMRSQRGDYHLTLGKLTALLEALPSSTPVRFDYGPNPGDETSYRGYYDDLAFEPINEPVVAGDLLVRCRRAATDTYEGYKGGDFRYGDRTPLWAAPWGCCGRAVMGAEYIDGALVLSTKDDE